MRLLPIPPPLFLRFYSLSNFHSPWKLFCNKTQLSTFACHVLLKWCYESDKTKLKHGFIWLLLTLAQKQILKWREGIWKEKRRDDTTKKPLLALKPGQKPLFLAYLAPATLFELISEWMCLILVGNGHRNEAEAHSGNYLSDAAGTSRLSGCF